MVSVNCLEEKKPLYAEFTEDGGKEMETLSGEAIETSVKQLDVLEFQNEEKPSSRRCRWSWRSALLVVLLAVVGVVVVPVVVVLNKKSISSTATSVEGSSQEPPGAEENTEPEEDEPQEPPKTEPPRPFSTLDPIDDLNVLHYQRSIDSSPSTRLDPLRDRDSNLALPTNEWYENLLLLQQDKEPSADHRAYAVPYVVDAAGAIPGLRIHSFRVDATATTVTLAVNEPQALTLGATVDFRFQDIDSSEPKGYSVRAATKLGVTLEWVGFEKCDLRKKFKLSGSHEPFVFFAGFF
jgi:hypothetical protein